MPPCGSSWSVSGYTRWVFFPLWTISVHGYKQQRLCIQCQHSTIKDRICPLQNQGHHWRPHSWGKGRRPTAKCENLVANKPDWRQCTFQLWPFLVILQCYVTNDPGTTSKENRQMKNNHFFPDKSITWRFYAPDDLFNLDSCLFGCVALWWTTTWFQVSFNSWIGLQRTQDIEAVTEDKRWMGESSWSPWGSFKETDP